MKRTAIIVALALVGVGLLLGFGALAALNFDFTSLGTEAAVTTTYSVDEPFADISVAGEECTVRIMPSEDGLCRVVCTEYEDDPHSVTVRDNVLVIERERSSNRQVHFGIFIGKTGLTLYLPDSAYGALTVQTGSGDIALSEGLSFHTATLHTSSGSIQCGAAIAGELTAMSESGEMDLHQTAPETLNITALSGTIILHDVQAQNVAARMSSGDMTCTNVLAAEALHLESSSGAIRLLGCDAASLWIRTDSGDVSGWLCTEKIFLADTGSGRIHLPRTASGGVCEITTGSGDVSLTIGEK